MNALMQPWVTELTFKDSLVIQEFFRFRINADSRNLIALRNWINRRMMLDGNGNAVNHPAMECKEPHLQKSYPDPTYYSQCMQHNKDLSASEDAYFEQNMRPIVKQAYIELAQYRFKYVLQFLRCLQLLAAHDSDAFIRKFWKTTFEDFCQNSGIIVI